MKKLFIAAIAFMFSFSVFAQVQDLSEGLQAKNAGNEAYLNKEFVKAIENWDKYLNSGEEAIATDANTKELYISSFKFAADEFVSKEDNKSAIKYYKLYFEKGGVEAAKDEKSIFNVANIARKEKDNAMALEYFQRSAELNYRGDVSLYYVAVIQRELGYEDKMKETLNAALVKYPDSRFRQNMINLLSVPLLKEAAEPFNQANALAKTAASGDPTAYLVNMEKAIVKFQEAIPLFEKVLAVDPNNQQAATYLSACNDNIKSYNDYKLELEKKK